jgi:hypothetical protein
LRSILPLYNKLRSHPSHVSLDCGRPGSLRGGYKLGIHQGKAEVSDTCSTITIDEYIRPSKVTMNDIPSMKISQTGYDIHENFESCNESEGRAIELQIVCEVTILRPRADYREEWAEAIRITING